MAAKKSCESFSKSFVEEVNRWGCMKQTGVSLRYMMEFGSKPTKKNLLISAQFLHKELPIRIARRAIELETLPHGLSENPARFKGVAFICAITTRDLLTSSAGNQIVSLTSLSAALFVVFPGLAIVNWRLHLTVEMDNNDMSRFVLESEMQRQLVIVAFAVVGVAYVVVARHYERRLLRNRTFVRHETRLQYLDSIIGESDIECVNQLRMDRRSFGRLCELLRGRGGLKNDGTVSVEEQVCMFLHILAHHVKVRTIRNRFFRSSETISRYFNSVLKALIRLHGLLLQAPQPILDDCTDERWKCFKNCLGALDGTYIQVYVPSADKPRYRTRKGEIATNVLGVCSPDMMFIFVLPGWEGSASDSRVLRDALSRPTGLRVPVGYYYLVDAGYTNCERFLAPYRGTRYHLSEWRDGYLPQNHQEYFNKKHASARNVIERCFGLLKRRWAILRSPSFYPIRTHTRIITAYCLLHNFIRRQMSTDPLENEVDDLRSDSADGDDDLVSQVGSTGEWTLWRDNLATEMFNTWNHNRST